MNIISVDETDARDGPTQTLSSLPHTSPVSSPINYGLLTHTQHQDPGEPTSVYDCLYWGPAWIYLFSYFIALLFSKIWTCFIAYSFTAAIKPGWVWITQTTAEIKSK